MLDEMCRDRIKDKNMLVPWWLMAAYSYEIDNSPIISDALFDDIAIQINDHWDEITHWHKDLLDRTMIKSSIACKKWPERVIGAAKRLQDINK